MPPNCRNRGAALAGPYCAACGQAEEDGHAATVSHFLREAFQEVSNVDGKVPRTVVALFTRPGRLTAEYWEGRRASWVRPLRIFLLAAALHLVTVPGIGPMNFDILLQRTPDGSLDVSVGTAARRRAGQSGLVEVSEPERLAYLDRLRDLYSTTRYLAPLAFAAATWLVSRRRQPLLASHIVMAAHFYAFWSLVSPLPLPDVAHLVRRSCDAGAGEDHAVVRRDGRARDGDGPGRVALGGARDLTAPDWLC